MSTVYNIFGIPRTFDEFVDKVQNRGDKHVNIIIAAYNDSRGFGIAPNYRCIVGVQSGNAVVRLKEYTHIRIDLYHAIVGKAEVQQNSLRDALAIAEKLKDLSIESTVNDESIDQTKKRLAQYDEEIPKLKAQYNISDVCVFPQSSKKKSFR